MGRHHNRFVVFATSYPYTVQMIRRSLFDFKEERIALFTQHRVYHILLFRDRFEKQVKKKTSEIAKFCGGNEALKVAVKFYDCQ